MNRRSLFKFLGIGAATAALSPKMLAQPTPNIDWRSILDKLNIQNQKEDMESYFQEQMILTKERLQAILPNNIQVDPQCLVHLKILQERQRKLGVEDIQALQKVKHNV